jgi:hypothetical protein
MPTDIKLKNSVTATNAPTSLQQGEVAINITDKKMWVGNAATTPVQILGTGSGGGGAAGSNTQVQFNSSGALAGSANLTFSGTILTATGFAGPINGTVGATTANTGAFTTLGATGVATFSAGTVSLPAITTTGDTNTGIFFPAADTIAFTEGGVESMRIDSAGNVGIGTSSPARPLQVSTASDTLVRIVGGAANARGVEFYDSSSNGSQIYSVGSDIRFFTVASASSTERMRLDSSGNLGLGVTPSAWGTANSVRALQMNAGSFWSFSTSALAMAQNSYYNGTNYIYSNTATATQYVQTSGAHQWFTAPSGTAGNAITFTQAMTLDANGSLLIANTSSYNASSKLQVTSANIGVDNGGGGQAIMAITSDAFATDRGASLGLGGKNSSGGNVVFGAIAGRSEGSGNAGYLQFATLNSGGTMAERMRIDSSGNLFVAKTSSNLNTVGCELLPLGVVQFTRSAASGFVGYWNIQGGSGGIQEFYFANVSKGSITVAAGGTTYATTSDYRLKENVAPMTGALAKIAELKPVTYKWKADGSSGQGFIAHELAEVVSDAVTGEKDAVDAEGKPIYQGIDTSFLVATLTAAIQEQQALIENLTTRLNALEGK